MLDGITWSGNNSSLETLAFNKPIVTCPGAMFRSRHSYAILKRIGVDDTIAIDLDHYTETAVELGLDKSLRNSVSENISLNKNIAYDDPEVVKGLEIFLQQAVIKT